jgi:hypothetical protein
MYRVLGTWNSPKPDRITTLFQSCKKAVVRGGAVGRPGIRESGADGPGIQRANRPGVGSRQRGSRVRRRCQRLARVFYIRGRPFINTGALARCSDAPLAGQLFQQFVTLASKPLKRLGPSHLLKRNGLPHGGLLWHQSDMAKKTKNAAAVALGRLGGLKGGKARAAKLSAAERSESARNAVLARVVRKPLLGYRRRRGN